VKVRFYHHICFYITSYPVKVIDLAVIFVCTWRHDHVTLTSQMGDAGKRDAYYYHLSSHFLLHSLGLIFHVNKTPFILQSFKESNKILISDKHNNNNIQTQGDRRCKQTPLFQLF